MPRLCAYFVRPSRMARTAASWTAGGVAKSGSPNSRWITSWPCRPSASARSNTSTARKGEISSVRRASSPNDALGTGRGTEVASGHSDFPRGPDHLAGDRRRDPLVEHARDHVLLVQLLSPDDGGDGLGSRDLHLVGDAGGPAVEEPPEEAREAQHVVDLVRIVGAPRGDHT